LINLQADDFRKLSVTYSVFPVKSHQNLKGMESTSLTKSMERGKISTLCVLMGLLMLLKEYLKTLDDDFLPVL